MVDSISSEVRSNLRIFKGGSSFHLELLFCFLADYSPKSTPHGSVEKYGGRQFLSLLSFFRPILLNCDIMPLPILFSLLIFQKSSQH